MLAVLPQSRSRAGRSRRARNAVSIVATAFLLCIFIAGCGLSDEQKRALREAERVEAELAQTNQRLVRVASELAAMRIRLEETDAKLAANKMALDQSREVINDRVWNLNARWYYFGLGYDVVLLRIGFGAKWSEMTRRVLLTGSAACLGLSLFYLPAGGWITFIDVSFIVGGAILLACTAWPWSEARAESLALATVLYCTALLTTLASVAYPPFREAFGLASRMN